MQTKVILFSYDPDLERVCAAAMRSCYSPHPAFSLFTNAAEGLEGEKPFDRERVQSLLRKALELGHHDILEHGQFSFDVQGISRACSHQLVRHRLASFSQQSQRYVKVTRSYGYIKPPSIKDGLKVSIAHGSQKLDLSFEDLMEIIRTMEEEYLKLGVRAEDTRYIRPNAAATNIVLSLNPRSLLHVLGLRCAPDAQWEIRDIAWALYACAKIVAPTIYERLPNSGNDFMQKKMAIITKIVEDCRGAFEATTPGRLFEIPLEGAGLDHPVTAYVLRR